MASTVYVKYGAGAKPFNKGAYSFLIALTRQLEQALEERPDELEDTLGALANGLAYLTGEDSGLLPGDGEQPDGLDDDVGEASGFQDEVAADMPAADARSGQRGHARPLVGAVAGTRVKGGLTKRVRPVTTEEPNTEVKRGKKRKTARR